jgi:chromosome segregation ATPase
LRKAEVENEELRGQQGRLREDFIFNLKLIEDRDADLSRLEACCAAYRKIITDKERERSELQIQHRDADAAVIRVKQALADTDLFYQTKLAQQLQQHAQERDEWETEARIQMDVWSAERRDLQTQIRQAEMSLQSASDEAVRASQLLLHTRERMSAEIARVREEERSLLREELSKALSERNEARGHLRSAEERVSDLEVQLSSLTTAADSANGTCHKLRKEMEAMAQTHATERENTAHRHTRQMKAVEDQRVRLEQRVQEFSSSLHATEQELRRVVSHSEQLQAQISALQAELQASRDTSLAERTTTSNEIASLKSKLDTTLREQQETLRLREEDKKLYEQKVGYLTSLFFSVLFLPFSLRHIHSSRDKPLC